MVRGASDYGAYAAKSNISPISDMGELAQRLGAVQSIDRRGDVLWFDDFEHGIEKWTGAGSGTGNMRDWVANEAEHGGFSYGHTCGSTSPYQSQQEYYLPYPTPGELGLEVSLKLNTNITEFRAYMTAYDGAAFIRLGVKYNVATATFSYIVAGGSFVDLSPTKVLLAAYLSFSKLKIVGDIAAGEYMRIIVNDKQWDLPTIAGYSGAIALEPHVNIWIYFIGTSGHNPKAYVDSVIVTQNEP